MIGWRVEEGDARAVLAGLEPGSVQCCVTSPPYFGLRDYGVEGQIGLEGSPDEYVAALVEVFRGVRRVLRDDGTVWLNLGDSYAGSWGAQSRAEPVAGLSGQQVEAHPKRTHTGSIPPGAGYKPKDLLGVPWMVAFALRADGWYLRSEIVWSKPNPMPESVRDRPTKAHEQVFLLSKSPRYFYDADAIREPHEMRPQARPNGHKRRRPGPLLPEHTWSGTARDEPGVDGHPAGRNKRSVWTVPTRPFPGAHFATFPPTLVEPMILAGTSPQACGECGAPWERVVERTPTSPPESRTVGWAATCEHGDGSGSCVVLDPFCGAGTTGMVALRHGRSFVGVELNAEYAEMARERIRADAPLLNGAGDAA